MRPPVPRRSPRSRALPLALLALLAAGSAAAEWTVDLATGSAWKAPTTLHLEQDGHPPTTIGGVVYETRPWNTFDSLLRLTENYYTLRVGYLFEGGGFEGDDAPRALPDFGLEVELLHDKIYYLRGEDPEGAVQHFELSDGVNYLTLNAVVRQPLWRDADFPRGRLQLLARAGAGPVIAKPATTIRGRERGHDIQGTTAGYEFSGLGLQLGAQAKWFATPWLASSLEVKGTYAAPRASIADGWSATPLWTVHVAFGVSIAP